MLAARATRRRGNGRIGHVRTPGGRAFRLFTGRTADPLVCSHLRRGGAAGMSAPRPIKLDQEKAMAARLDP